MKIDLQKHWGDRELYCIGELCAKIIQSMQQDGSVYLWTHEGKNPANNGFYVLLDELCNFWGWDKSAITLDTTNIATAHDEYNIVHTKFSIATAALDRIETTIEWTGEKYYGMFIGRANASRIRAIHNHYNFKHKEFGLTSFHDDLFNFMNKPELVDYFFHSGQTYQEMLAIKPYSDIDIVLKPPIIFGKSTVNWGEVYKKIAIEVVCETSTLPGCIDMSEKTYRPMLHKKPFLLIGSPGQLEYLTLKGFKTFSSIFPEDYDQLSGIQRVDRIFEILKQLIETNSIDTLIEKCHNILEHNWTLLTSEIEMHRNIILKGKLNGK
jgi:uncharacterized protein YerC